MALPRSGNTLFASIMNQNPNNIRDYERFIFAKTD